MPRKSLPVGFQLRRMIRTASSEVYIIFRTTEDETQGARVGSLDLHIVGKIFYGTLVLEITLKTKELESLLTQINDQLIDIPGEREDFILTVFKGKEVGFYSDIISEQEQLHQPATHGDLKNISATLNKVLGRHQDARGKLNEHALSAYFQSLGYEAKLAGADLDHQKIDVIATKDNEIIYAQAKLGSISKGEMKVIVRSVANLPLTGSMQKIAAITAAIFPPDCEIVRLQLELEFGIPLLCIQQYQIIQAVPEYRRMLAE